MFSKASVIYSALILNTLLLGQTRSTSFYTNMMRNIQRVSESERSSNNHSSVVSKQNLSKQTETYSISRPGLRFLELLSRGCPTTICQASSLSLNPRRSPMRTILKPLSGGVWARRKKRRKHLKRGCPATYHRKILVTNLQNRIQPEEEHSTFLMEVKDQSYLSENNLKPLWDQVA